MYTLDFSTIHKNHPQYIKIIHNYIGCIYRGFKLGQSNQNIQRTLTYLLKYTTGTPIYRNPHHSRRPGGRQFNLIRYPYSVIFIIFCGIS
jgi:hypothetical protein